MNKKLLRRFLLVGVIGCPLVAVVLLGRAVLADPSSEPIGGNNANDALDAMDIVSGWDFAMINRDFTTKYDFRLDVGGGSVTFEVSPIEDGPMKPMDALLIYNNGGYDEYPIENNYLQLTLPLEEASDYVGWKFITDFQMRYADGTVDDQLAGSSWLNLNPDAQPDLGSGGTTPDGSGPGNP